MAMWNMIAESERPRAGRGGPLLRSGPASSPLRGQGVRLSSWIVFVVGFLLVGVMGSLVDGLRLAQLPAVVALGGILALGGRVLGASAVLGRSRQGGTADTARREVLTVLRPYAAALSAAGIGWGIALAILPVGRAQLSRVAALGAVLLACYGVLRLCAQQRWTLLVSAGCLVGLAGLDAMFGPLLPGSVDPLRAGSPLAGGVTLGASAVWIVAALVESLRVLRRARPPSSVPPAA